MLLWNIRKSLTVVVKEITKWSLFIIIVLVEIFPKSDRTEGIALFGKQSF
ncbi:MAG: hypothetical protein Q8L88_13310 [Bacteroidota bacterium]|nr:hypothetical protein [Bacteroidota bacterium]